MLFSPADRQKVLWDSWLFYKNATYHLYHLMKRPGERSKAINHAISSDLVNWKDLGPVIQTGDAGSWDAGPLLTGTVVEFKGTYYMFYGSRGIDRQLLGIAVSSDLYCWEKYGDQPILNPDPRWYETDVKGSRLKHVAWRDPSIVLDDKGVFHLFLCARSKDGPYNGKGAIAHATSDDLLSWEQCPPVHISNRYTFLEVPDVFYFHGLWYLIFCCGEWHTCRSREWPEGASGIRYLVSNAIDGPYAEPDDSLLLGSAAGALHNYAGRSIARSGIASHGRLFYYNNVFPNSVKDRGGFRGSWAMPKELIYRDGQLRLGLAADISNVFLDGLKPLGLESRHMKLDTETEAGVSSWKYYVECVEGTVDEGYSVSLDADDFDSLYLEARMTGDCRSCGLIVNYRTDTNDGAGLMVDFQKSFLHVCDAFMGEFGWIFIPRASISLVTDKFDKSISNNGIPLFSIIVKDFFMDLYREGILLGSFHISSDHGRWGFFTEDGKAEFSDVKIFGSNNPIPFSCTT